MAKYLIPLMWLMSTMYLIYLDKAYWWIFCVFAVLFAATAYGTQSKQDQMNSLDKYLGREFETEQKTGETDEN